MRLDVSYKIVNNEFDKEYAEEYNEGEPGPGNMKYHETWKYRIENVKQFSQEENATLEIVGINESEGKHTFQINNLFHLSCELNNGSVEDYYVSKALIRNTHATKDKNNNNRFYFYLDVNNPFVIINDTSYIVSDDLPEELTSQKWKTLTLPSEVKSKLIEKSGSIARSFNE
jgi:hypothetical protein